MRILHFDIDGVILDYEDRVKPRLAGGALERAVVSAGFSQLVCVSGWSELIQSPAARVPSERQDSALHQLLANAFPDGEGFLRPLVLTTATDRRGQAIDLAGV